MKSIQSKIISATVGLLALPAFAADGVSGTSANNAGATSTGTSSGHTAGDTNPNTAAPSPLAAKTTTPGFYTTGGRVYRIENGRATPVNEVQTMRISPNGIIGFDGRPLSIPEGQMMSSDGRLVPLPSNVSGLPNVGTGVRAGAIPSPTGVNAGISTEPAGDVPAAPSPETPKQGGATGTGTAGGGTATGTSGTGTGGAAAGAGNPGAPTGGNTGPRTGGGGAGGAGTGGASAGGTGGGTSGAGGTGTGGAR